jgi:hypothetical protein
VTDKSGYATKIIPEYSGTTVLSVFPVSVLVLETFFVHIFYVPLHFFNTIAVFFVFVII